MDLPINREDWSAISASFKRACRACGVFIRPRYGSMFFGSSRPPLDGLFRVPIHRRYLHPNRCNVSAFRLPNCLLTFSTALAVFPTSAQPQSFVGRLRLTCVEYGERRSVCQLDGGGQCWPVLTQSGRFCHPLLILTLFLPTLPSPG